MSELLNLAWPNIITFLFVFIRIGIIFSIVPFFSTEIVPRALTAAIALFMSLVLMPVIPPVQFTVDNINAMQLFVVLMHELMIGLCLGLGIEVIFTGMQTAGQLAGFQMGFAIANVVDPMTGIDAPITSNLFYIVCFLLFISLDGHYILIKALVDSFSVVPISDTLPSQGFLLACLSYAGNMFIIALKISAPVIGVMLLINIAFAIISRAVPQMNVFIMAFPITIAVGLFFIIIIIKMMPDFMNTSILQAWDFMKGTMAKY